MSAPLSDLAASFRRDLRADGKADRTVTLYLQAIRFFGDWCQTQTGKEATLADLTADKVKDWFAYLNDRFKPGTVGVRYQGMKRFCGWLLAEGDLTKDPMRGITKPDIPDAPVPVFTDEELANLIKACQGKTFDDRRDEAMVRLLIDCGIRVAELCGLTLDDVVLDAEAAMVIGKGPGGGRKRMVYFGARTARALDRYKRMRAQHRWAHLDAFFLSRRGALSTDGARYRMEIRSEQAGLTGRGNPHRHRHTWAHDFLLSGGQERDLKRLAGWSSDVMLERYGASAADARARAAAKKLRRGDRV
jgi:site-specific recombinase XerD